MEEERESGVTFRDICRMIGKRIWWVLGISVLIAVAAALIVAFVLNPGSDTYSVAFMIEYPNGNTTYPDGTSLRYETIVYAENLQEVKESDEAFADIDIEKMSSDLESGIKIAERTMEGTEPDTIRYTGIYELTCSSAYFSSEEQGEKFMRALANHIIETVEEKFASLDFTSWETVFAGVDSYSSKVSAVRSQYDSLVSRYNSYTGTGAYASFAALDGKTLTTLRNELTNLLGTRISKLETELSNNKYVLSEAEENRILENIANLQLDLQKKQQRLENTLAQLDALYNEVYGGNLTSSQLDTFESFHSAIQTLTAEISDTKFEIERLYKSIGYTQETDGTWKETGSVSKNEAFETELNAVKDALVEQTALCKQALENLYTEFSYIDFEQSGIVVTGGGMSPVLIAAVGFVLGFIVVGLIFCAVDYPAYKRKQLAEEQAALAEAAASEAPKD